MNRTRSHIPVIIATIRSFRIDSVLEFGMGDYSTRLFCKCRCIDRITSVESNPKWYKKIADLYKDKKGFNPVFHPTSFPSHSNVQDAEEAKRCLSFYKRILHEKKYDLSFIDTFIAMRKLALQAVLGNVRYIVLHDTEQKKWYAPYLDQLSEEYVRYRFRCQAPSTDLIIRKKEDNNIILDNLHRCGFRYAQKNVVQYRIDKYPSQ